MRVALVPPLVNCTHPRENEKCVQFFFLHECFGAITPFGKPNIENPSRFITIWSNEEDFYKTII